MMKIVAIIHARGGSKRIPLKNICILGEKPLIAYPIELSRSVGRIDRIIVSTDHPEISDAAIKFGAEVPFVRPRDISEDVASELVTEHALKYMINEENYQPEIVVTLTPCTPFTKPEDLDRGLDLLLKNPDWDSVVTVRRAEEFPEWMIEYEIGKPCRTLLGNSLDGEYNISQNIKQRYYPLGAFFINKVESFLAFPSMYGKTWGAIELSQKNNIDIDTFDELDRAKTMVRL
jgi:CMP-N,N'-diacetyllegionaminic acid synthase